ncbi:hypothetical protein [Actinomycetospora aeridis]|uniref:Uncharacterized protein n=1 Tax=Actinomycetospora aeridis TaxID=3129231 RepID=A0ABU8N1F3_9PSEU
MSRHRAAPARAAAPAPEAPTSRTATAVLTGGRRAADPTAVPAPALPRQGLTEAHPSGPLPRARSARGTRSSRGLDADTAALDLAAIALAAASAGPAGRPAGGAHTGETRLPRTGSTPVSGAVPAADPTTGGTPRPAYPAAVPSALAPPTPPHAAPAVGRRDRRVPLPTRTAGALALIGALAGGGVAVVGGNAVLTADPTPTTGEFRAPGAADVANAAESAAAAAQLPAADQGERQGGRHRADTSADSGGY